jgi:hypothetical protein
MKEQLDIYLTADLSLDMIGRKARVAIEHYIALRLHSGVRI